MVFILVPDDGTQDWRYSFQAATKACRVAHQLGLVPMSPMLMLAGYLSRGEMSMTLREYSQRWLRRCDKIWLQFPSDETEDLDGISYELLDKNQRTYPRSRAQHKGRRAVYQLHYSGDDKIGHVPVAMSKEEISDLLLINYTSGLARQCV